MALEKPYERSRNPPSLQMLLLATSLAGTLQKRQTEENHTWDVKYHKV